MHDKLDTFTLDTSLYENTTPFPVMIDILAPACSDVSCAHLSAICREVLTPQCFDRWLCTRVEGLSSACFPHLVWLHEFIADATGYHLAFMSADEQYTTWRLLHVISRHPYQQGTTEIAAPAWVAALINAAHLHHKAANHRVEYVSPASVREMLAEVHRGVLHNDLSQVRADALPKAR